MRVMDVKSIIDHLKANYGPDEVLAVEWIDIEDALGMLRIDTETRFAASAHEQSTEFLTEFAQRCMDDAGPVANTYYELTNAADWAQKVEGFVKFWEGGDSP